MVMSFQKATTLILVTGMMVLCLLFLIGRAGAKTITVDDDEGADYTSIQDALDDSNHGDIIRVFNGTYYENLRVSREISLIGNGSGDTIIDGGGEYNVVRIVREGAVVSGFSVMNSGEREAGIWIDTDNVTVRDNTISYCDYGIEIREMNYCTIVNNTCFSNGDTGILVSESNYNTINNNYCYNNSDDGMSFYRAMNNSISFNRCDNNSDAGIIIRADSKNNNVTGNNCSGNQIGGIYISSSEFVHCSDNNLVMNSFSIWGWEIEHWNTHTIDSSNSVNGKQVFFAKNASKLLITSDYGQIILANVSDSRIENLKFDNGSQGISIGFSLNITLANITVEDNAQGIYIGFSFYINISNVTCIRNGNGIMIEESENTHISEVTSMYNRGIGIYLPFSRFNKIENSTCSFNEGRGIFIQDSDSTVVTNCIVSHNYYGIHISGTRKAVVENNFVTDNHIGIQLTWDAVENTAYNNEIVRNSEFGINASDNDETAIIAIDNWWGDVSGPYHPLNNSDGEGDNVTDNVLFDPWIGKPHTWYVDDDASDGGNGSEEHPFNHIQDAINAAESGDTIRVFAGYYEENVVVNKSVSVFGNGSINTTIYGGQNEIPVHIVNDWCIFTGFKITAHEFSSHARIVVNSNFTEIFNNSCFSHQHVGIQLDSADHNKIFNNILSDMAFGINLVESDFNIITKNICSDIYQYGINLEESNQNSVINNTCLNNRRGINIRSSSNDNLFADNTCSNNDFGILLGSSSSFNSIENNTCSNNGDGIQIGGATNNTINNNLCIGNNVGISIEHSETNIINENNCSENSKYGVEIFRSNNNSLNENVLEKNERDGIYIILGNNNFITSNSIRENDIHGIFINDGHYNEIINNNIDENRIGIELTSASKGNIAGYNIIFNNEDSGINATNNDGYVIEAINNWWGDPSGPYHEIKNSEGKGDEITDNVTFEPWLREPKTWYVDDDAPSGGDGSVEHPFNKIQDAIDHAYAGWRIRIFDGTYDETLVIDKPLKIIGNSSSSTIIDGFGASSAITITSDFVEISGLGIRNASETGISLTNSSGITITSCTITDIPLDFNLSNSHLITFNTHFNTVNFSDLDSTISVHWPLKMKVIDNRSGSIPNAHVRIIDTYSSTIFDSYTDENGKSYATIREYNLNLTARKDHNPYTLSIRKNGYLNFSEELDVTSFTSLICQLQTHILPQSIISGELMRNVNMDSPIFFDGTESTGRSISYFWEFGNDSSSTSPTPSHTYTSPGVYQVNLTVTDDYENTSITSIAVIVQNVLPTAQANADANSTFEDEVIQFDASGSWDTLSDSLSFHWDFGDGTQSTEVSPIHAFQNQGEYTVTLTATDEFGGESKAILSISVTNTEPWIITTNVTGMQYPGKPLYFTLTADDTTGDVPSLEYTWDFGDGTIANQQNVTHVFQDAGMFSVTVTVTDNNGASDSEDIQIIISDPEITTSVSSTSIFQDEEVFFDASHELDDGSFVYTWHFGDGTKEAWNETSHTYNQSGIFWPYLIIDNGIENITIFMQEIMVRNVIPTPIPVVDKLLVSEDESLPFDASNSVDSTSDRQHLTYIWDFGDGTTGVGIEVSHAFTEMGSFTVMLTVNDGKITNTTQVEIQVENVPPTANAGTLKERKATEGKTVILDASQTLDTDSDLPELNYTWKTSDTRIYGEIVNYTFETAGSFTVVLEVRDNNGATSEDTLTFEVSKSSEPEDEETMSTTNWILVVIIIVILLVIGFLITSMRNEALYLEMIAEREAEETIVVEGEIDQESYKPKDDVEGATVVVDDDQDVEISDAEGWFCKGEMDDESFKPPNNIQKVTIEVAGDQDEKMPDAKMEVVEESENEDERNDGRP